MSAPKSGLPEYNGLARTQPTLPSEWYFDPDHFQREMTAIWKRNWVYLCHGSALPNARDFRLFEIAGQQILLLRDEERALRAFHNTCRHRGSQICTEQEGRLKAKRLVCPYHRWSYSLQGELLTTSSLFEPEDFDKADYPLYPVRLELWGGFVFAKLDGAEGPSLEESFTREPVRLENWPLERLVTAKRYSKIMECNWKVFWENFNECLHCPNIHPELSRLVPIYGRSIMARKDDPDWAARADSADPKDRGGLREGAVTWSSDGQTHGKPIEGLPDEALKAGQSYVTQYPSFFLVGHSDYLRAVRLRPLGPERTELQAEWLFTPESLEAPGFDLASYVDFCTLVMEQDAAACEMNQAGLKARPHEAGVLMPEEYAIADFHDFVRRELAR